MHIEDLQTGKWYLLSTVGNSITGMPLKVVGINPPFVLVKDVDSDMLVIDTRAHMLSPAQPKFVKKFRQLWNETRKRRHEQNVSVCMQCGTLCEPSKEE